MNAPAPVTNDPSLVEQPDSATTALEHGETQPIAQPQTRGEMPPGAKLESEIPGDDEEDADLGLIAETFEAIGAGKQPTTPTSFDPDPDSPQARQASSAGPNADTQVAGQTGAPPQEQSATGAQPAQGQGQPAAQTPASSQQPQGGQPAATPAQATQQNPQEQQPAQPSVRPFQDTFAQLRQQIEEKKSEIEGSVATQLYSLSDEERDLLVTEPEKVLPQMAARVHLNAVTAVLTQISQRLPAMVLTLMEVQKAHVQAEDQFWNQFPTLNRQTDANTVMTLMKTYRQANPNATQEEAIKQVGAMAVVALGKHLQPNQQQQAPASQPVVRQVPARTAFQPAGNGQAVPSQAKPQYASEWDRTLAGLQEFEAGDM